LIIEVPRVLVVLVLCIFPRLVLDIVFV